MDERIERVRERERDRKRKNRYCCTSLDGAQFLHGARLRPTTGRAEAYTHTARLRDAGPCGSYTAEIRALFLFFARRVLCACVFLRGDGDVHGALGGWWTLYGSRVYPDDSGPWPWT